MMRQKSVVWIVLSKIFGLICFFLLLYILNILTIYIKHPIFNTIVVFLNSNVSIIFVMAVIFMIADLFSALGFPLNLPYPFFSAFGSLFVAQFIFRGFALLDLIIKQNIFQGIALFSFIVYPIVFVIVLITGYIKLFKKETEEVRRGNEHRSYIAETWEDVESEFKQTLYDFLKLIRESINSGRAEKRRRKTGRKRKRARKKR